MGEVCGPRPGAASLGTLSFGVSFAPSLALPLPLSLFPHHDGLSSRLFLSRVGWPGPLVTHTYSFIFIYTKGTERRGEQREGAGAGGHAR